MMNKITVILTFFPFSPPLPHPSRTAVLSGRHRLQHKQPGDFKSSHSSDLPKHVRIFRPLHKYRRCANVRKGGPFLADQCLDLVESAVDLGADIAGIEAPPPFVDCRGARNLD